MFFNFMYRAIFIYLTIFNNSGKLRNKGLKCWNLANSIILYKYAFPVPYLPPGLLSF